MSYDSPSTYFRQNSKAFDQVVRLVGTKPGQYDKDEMQDKIDQYAALTSLGDVHKEGLADIKSLLEKYNGTSDAYPEAKGYGVVGQYGDGKTHFLTQIHKLLKNESDIVCPEGTNLLTLDPFNFTGNPADIVEALRERVKAEIGPGAASDIASVRADETAEVKQELVSMGMPEEKAEEVLRNREVQSKLGKDAGIAFAEGCKSTVANELYDAIVLLMDEIEGIVRGDNVRYEDLDRYREFFDEIDRETPVLMVMTAPRDQWSRFHNVHQALMDRMFGAEPRQSVRLRPLNEQELVETWTRRREQYLVREGVSLPPAASDDLFPLHTTTLRAIYQISQRANSNRTAINLMESGYQQFFKWDELRWVTPGETFRNTNALTTGDGGFFITEEYKQILKHDDCGVLTSIAATLTDGISEQELLEVLQIDSSTLNERLIDLRENGWLERRQTGDQLTYQLTQMKIAALLKEGDAETTGELKRIVETTISNVTEDDDVLYRNLCEILQDTDPFSNDLITGSINVEESWFLIESSYGRFRDRRILVATGNQSPDKLEDLRADHQAELVVAIDFGDHDYTQERILPLALKSLSKPHSYDVEELEYELKTWTCAYRQLKAKLDGGGNALLSGLRSTVVGTALGINEFQFGSRLGDRLADIYPTYPGPMHRMNGNARDAYITALKDGVSQQNLDWEDIEPLGKASTRDSVEGYIDEWLDYDLVSIVSDTSPRTVRIQISGSERLILDILDEAEDEAIDIGDLTMKMEVHGYPKDDVTAFVEILEYRGKVRRDERTITKTTEDTHQAKIYFDAVKEVADWLTSDEFPEQFRRDFIPNRDEIVGLRTSCQAELDRIAKGDRSEVANPIENLVTNIGELQHETSSAIKQFETTRYAEELIQSGQRIDEIRELIPEVEESSSDFYTAVSTLNSTPSGLANSARAFLEQELDADSEINVFSSLQSLHDEFLEEYTKVGTYNEYNTEVEISAVIDTFREIRPAPSSVASAVRAIETFEERVTRAKRLARMSNSVLGQLMKLEALTLEDYDPDVESELGDEAREVIELFDQAGEEYRSVSSMIAELKFKQMDGDDLETVEEAIGNGDDLFEKAQEKQDYIDQEITRRASEITESVEDVRAGVRKINSQPNWTVLQQIVTPDVRQEASDWRDDFEEFTEKIEESATTTLNIRPSTVSELQTLRETYASFEQTADELTHFKCRLNSYEEDYFDAEKDDIPPGRRQEIDAKRSRSLPPKDVKAMAVLFDRVEMINKALDVNVDPMEDRIKKLVRSRPAVTPDDLAGEIPNEDFLETESEVMKTLSSLISAGDLELGYNDQVVVE